MTRSPYTAATPVGMKERERRDRKVKEMNVIECPTATSGRGSRVRTKQIARKTNAQYSRLPDGTFTNAHVHTHTPLITYLLFFATNQYQRQQRSPEINGHFPLTRQLLTHQASLTLSRQSWVCACTQGDPHTTNNGAQLSNTVYFMVRAS